MDNYNQSGYGYNQSEQTVVSDYPAEGNIVVSNNAKYTLDSITKWVKILAILGIIGCVFIIIVGFIAMVAGGFADSELGGSRAAIAGAFAGLIYIITGALYLYPATNMLSYANKMKSAIRSNRQDLYEDALSNFKSAVIFMGILAIISFAFVALALFGFIMGDVLRAF